jgi:hypothetical protein
MSDRLVEIYRDDNLKENLYLYSRKIFITSRRGMFPKILKDTTTNYGNILGEQAKQFLEYVSKIRINYKNGLAGVLKNDNKENCNNEVGEYLIDLFSRICKGTYFYSKNNDFMSMNGMEIPISQGSSGQQAVVYMLLALFNVFMSNKQHLIIIEEPESHLFPYAQKLLMEYIITVMNATKSRVIITTHSPYILTSANMFMYSAKVDGTSISNDDKVLLPSRISSDRVMPLFFHRDDNNRFQYENILDAETGMINVKEIDSVSKDINEVMHTLILKEVCKAEEDAGNGDM